jgi:quercetin dioxygenase-like cupin family protein
MTSLRREVEMSEEMEELAGWDMNQAADVPAVPWGGGDDARAKVLASGDGYLIALVEADAGYRGTPHEHTSTEFLYVLQGRIRTQGRVLEAGGAYVASQGSRHTHFEVEAAASYLSIFKV